MKIENAYTGFKNPCLALLVCVEGVWPEFMIDKDSFLKAAEICGDAPQEILAEGFVINDDESFNKLCEIANCVVFMDHNSQQIKCVAADKYKERKICDQFK